MKKSKILFSLVLVMVISLCTAFAIQTYSDDAISAIADDTVTQTEITVADVNYTPQYAGFAGPCISIHFDVESLGLADWTQLTDEATQRSKISLIDKDGNPVAITFLDSQGAYVMVNRSQSYVCSVGDILTFKAGFTVGNYVIKEDVSYQYATENTPWVLYTDELPTPSEGGDSEEPAEKTALTVTSVNYANIGYGDGIVVGFEVDLGLGYWNEIDMQDKVSLIGSDGTERTVARFESCGTSVYVNRSQSYICSVGDILTLKAGLVIGEYEIKEDVSYQYATENTPWVLYTDELPTPSEGGDSEEPAEKTALTVTSVNYANIGYGDGIVVGFGVDLGLGYWNVIDMQDKVSLIGSDGTERTVARFESCGTSVYVNRSQSYICSVGDILTLKAGLVIGEYEIKEDVSYQYVTENTTWELYTDELPTPSEGGDSEEPVEKTEVTVKTMQFYPTDLAYRGTGVYIEFSVGLNLGNWDTKLDASKVSVKDSDGNDKSFNLYMCGGGIAIRQYDCAVGDIITIEEGFTVGDFILSETAIYVCKTIDGYWVVYGSEPEPETELTFMEAEGATYPYIANYIHDLTWGVPAMIFRFNTAKEFADYQGASTIDLIEYKNAFGEVLPIRDCIFVGSGNFLLRWSEPEAPVYAMAGDTVTFKKGFALAGNEKLAEDMTFIVLNATSGQLAPYSEDYAPQGLSITTTDEYSQLTVNASVKIEYAIESGIGTAYFTSSDNAIATVTKDGVVTGVAEGEVTITAHLGDETAEYTMTILPESAIAGLELVHNYTIWVPQNEQLTLPELSAHIVFENGLSGMDFALTAENCVLPEIDTSVLGNQTVQLTITYQDEEYTVDVTVTVYEITGISIKTVAIVDWFNYAIFIQYPDSTANTANITKDINKLDSTYDHITYKRADGTDVPINGCYMLSGGNLAIFPFSNLTEETYNDYYLDGDVITLQKGLKIWMWTGEKKPTETDNNAIAAGTGMYICEGILEQDVMYRYDGNVWSLYVEYTDITVSKTDITIQAGSTADSGVMRFPINATTGTFTYVCDDESVATVSSRGIIKALKEGTCTITVTLNGGTAGEKTVTLNVTVTDSIVGINIDVERLTVKKGGVPNLTGITATFKWASGKEGEAVDITNATLIGFDGNTVGEQTVVVSVTVDGVTYTGTITVLVEENASSAGCAGSVSSGLFLPLMILCAGVLLSKKKREI